MSDWPEEPAQPTTEPAQPDADDAVEPDSRGSAAVGIDTHIPATDLLWCTHLRPQANGLLVRDVLFEEDRADLGIVRRHVERDVGPAGDSDGRAVATYANFDRQEGPVIWRVWVSGVTLAFWSSVDSAPRRLNLGGAFRPIQPGLLVRSGACEVPLLSEDGQRIRFARVPVPGAPREPRIVFEHPLETPAVAGAACIDSEERGSHRWLALICPKEAGFDLVCLNLGNGESVRQSTVLPVEKGTALAHFVPCVGVDRQGLPRIATLFRPKQSVRSLALAEGSIDAKGSPAGVTVTELPDVGEPVLFGATSLTQFEGKAPRLDWVAGYEPGDRVIHNNSDGEVRRLRAPAARPVQLIGMSQCAYLLTSSADGPRLDMLP